MKQKYHLISSIISMILTSVLLIFVCLAWYVTNTTATASGINGSIVDYTSIIDKIEYYEATNKTDTSISFVKNSNTSNFEMGTYNPLDSASYPQRMLAITINSNINKVNLIAKTRATSYLGNTIQDSEGNFILSKNNNSLSSVISFNIPTNINSSNDTITATISSSNEKYFVELGENNTLSTNINIGDITPTNNVIYIILDYYGASIEYIYSENIGNPALDYSGEPTVENPHINDIRYVCDFYFMLKEVS